MLRQTVNMATHAASECKYARDCGFGQRFHLRVWVGGEKILLTVSVFGILFRLGRPGFNRHKNHTRKTPRHPGCPWLTTMEEGQGFAQRSIGIRTSTTKDKLVDMGHARYAPPELVVGNNVDLSKAKHEMQQIEWRRGMYEAEDKLASAADKAFSAENNFNT